MKIKINTNSNMKPANAITWQTLKDYCNSLNEEQLQYDVNAIGEERGFSINEASGLEEDYYIDDECMNPISVFEPSDNEDKLENYPQIKKGTPYLWFDFYQED